MRFCAKCGRQLADGEVCSCQTIQQQPVQQSGGNADPYMQQNAAAAVPAKKKGGMKIFLILLIVLLIAAGGVFAWWWFNREDDSSGSSSGKNTKKKMQSYSQTSSTVKNALNSALVDLSDDYDIEFTGYITSKDVRKAKPKDSSSSSYRVTTADQLLNETPFIEYASEYADCIDTRDDELEWVAYIRNGDCLYVAASDDFDSYKIGSAPVGDDNIYIMNKKGEFVEADKGDEYTLDDIIKQLKKFG